MNYANEPVRSVPKITRKPNRRKKNPHKQLEKHKGVSIPSRKVRAAISKKDYQDTIDHFGDSCQLCGDTPVELHHIKFRSQSGRSGYRNLIPLCHFHHRHAHTSKEFADKLREERIQKYSEWYWADRFDLWKAGHISSPEQDKFERWMKEHEKGICSEGYDQENSRWG